MKMKIFTGAVAFGLIACGSQEATARTYAVQGGYWEDPKITLYDQSNYKNSVSRAVTGWNALPTNVELYYHSTEPAGGYRITVASKPHDAAWVGAVDFTFTDGTKYSAEDGPVPAKPYAFAWCELNETAISNNNYDYDRKTILAGHEIGHALAAGHSDYSTRIMWRYINQVNGVVLAGDEEKQQMWMKYGVAYY